MCWLESSLDSWPTWGEEWSSSRGWAFPAESHHIGLPVSVEIQRAIPVIAGAETEGASTETEESNQCCRHPTFLRL